MSRRLAAVAAALLLLTSAASCGEYAHTNPYDPMVDIGGKLTGPDSAFSVLDTMAFAFSASAEFSGLTVTWSSDAPAVLQSLGDGRFVTHQTDGPRSVRVFADVGPHRFERQAVLRQGVARFLDCAGRAPYRTPLTFAVATYGREVCVQPVDARGFPVADFNFSPGTLVSRNGTAIRAGSVFFDRFMLDAMQDGSSWLVLTPARGAPDSVLVTLLRRITQVTVSPSNNFALANGQSTTLRFLRAFDASSLEITNAATIGTPRFFDCSAPAGGISVTADGVVTRVSASTLGKVCLAFTRDTVPAATVF